MGKARAELEAASSFDLAGHAEQLTARFKGGLSRLAQGATRGAQRVKGAAQDLRSPAVVQHAIAARERGNLEAAFWLFNEAFDQQPEPQVALDYWDVALSLGRVDIAAQAGVALVESQAAGGSPELAAQHWLELVKEAPEVLVSPATIATLLPALKQRLEACGPGSPDDPETLAGYLRCAVRQAVDPRNEGLHPGIAMRIFEEGRELNPEASRRAAEAALESPNLHEAKRRRLEAWLAGEPIEERAAERSAAETPAALDDAGVACDEPAAGLSADEIAAAAKRLARKPKASKATAEAAPATSSGPLVGTRKKTKVTIKAKSKERAGSNKRPSADGVEGDPAPATAPVSRRASPGASRSQWPPEPQGPRVRAARLAALDDDGLHLEGAEPAHVAWQAIEAVSVAEVAGLEADAVTLVDLILNWSQRESEELDIVRLRVSDLSLEDLVTGDHPLDSDFAVLMGDIMGRSHAIPLPDPESALGTQISRFESPEQYERIALRRSG